MPERSKPKSTKPKSVKTNSTKPQQATLETEANKEVPQIEQSSPSRFRISPRIGGIFTGIRSHWQFALTFFVACIGTWLLLNQNELLDTQNGLLGSQNSLLTNQNTLIKHQMSLEEANRRSSLVMLMSNIMDKVDKEIEVQQVGLSQQARERTLYSLSQSLIGQIAALSHSFKPYKYLNGDTLISVPLSPERGQLLITLTQLPLDTATFNRIYKSSTFKRADLAYAVLTEAYLSGADLREAALSYSVLTRAVLARAVLARADLKWANLRSSNLTKVNLQNANLERADLRQADLREVDLGGADLSLANLRWSNLSKAHLSLIISIKSRFRKEIEVTLKGANLENAELSGANLSNADLSGVNLKGADFSIEQILEAETICKSVGIDDSVIATILKTHPQLFEQPKKWQKDLSKHLDWEEVKFEQIIVKNFR